MLENKFWSIPELQSILVSQQQIPTYVSFVNPFSYYIFSERPDLTKTIDGFFVDGALLKFLHNATNARKKIERISFDFSSVANEMFEFSIRKSMAVALVGGSEEDVRACCSNLQARYPYLNIAYMRNGFFNSPNDIQKAIDEIIESKASMVVVGMGVPLQEEFLMHLRLNDSGSQIKLAFTCGGFITQTAIRTDYYLPIVKKLGLRWLQRIIMHSHVRKRVVKDYPMFLFKYLRNTISSRL